MRAQAQALSELQKENSGLRAACVTLGRELLALRGEFHAFRAQAAAALAAVSPAAAALLAGEAAAAVVAPVTPLEAGAGAASASAAAAVSAAAQQQQQQQPVPPPPPPQQQQQQQPAAAAPAAAAAEPAAAGPGMPAPAPLPAHMPAAAPVASAATPPAAELPPGDILMVGGHEGGSWLDSVGKPGEAGAGRVALPLLNRPRCLRLLPAAVRAPPASTLSAWPLLSAAPSQLPPRRLLLAQGRRVGQPADAGQAAQLRRRGGHRCA